MYVEKYSSIWGRGGGQVVSLLAFYSDDPISSPTDAYSFICKICVWKMNENKQKRPFFVVEQYLSTAISWPINIFKQQPFPT